MGWFLGLVAILGLGFIILATWDTTVLTRESMPACRALGSDTAESYWPGRHVCVKKVPVPRRMQEGT